MRFRPFTWVMLVINLLFLVWVIVGISQASGTPENCQSLSAETCNAAQDAGTAIGVGLVIGLWVAVDFILGIIWLITKPKKRDCPICGNDMKKGATSCARCGADMTAVYHQRPGSPDALA